MEEFAKIVYNQWLETEEAEEFNWGSEYDEAWKRVYDILNEHLATEIELSIMLSVKLDAPALCRLDAPDLDFACLASADCLHQHLQVI